MVFDEIIANQFLQSFSSPGLDLFFQAITFFGHPLPWLVLAAWLLWAGKEKKSFSIATLILLSSFIAGGIKELAARPRPEGILVLEKPMTLYSMPSGHSTIAAAVFSFFEKKVGKRKRLVLAALALATGASRLYLGVHFLSDVLAGLLIGYLVGKAAIAIEKRAESHHFHITKIKEEFLVAGLVAAVTGAFFLLPAELYAAQAFLGYYLGFAALMHTKMRPKPKNKLAALALGTMALGAIAALAYLSEGAASQLLFFISGLFISIIWPLAIHKAKL